MSRRGRVTVGVLVGVFILFTLLGWGIDAYTDYLWFNEVDKTSVYSGVLLTRLMLFLVIGAVMALIVGGNLYLAYRLRPLLRPHSAEQATLERYRMVLAPRLGLWITVLSVIIGFFAGLSAQGRWSDWMLFRNSQSFGQKDPQFNVDIGFYIFDYPLLRYLLGVGFTAVVLSVLGSLAVHYIFGGVRLQGVGDRMTTAARAHLTSLVAVFVLLKAVAYVLDQRALLLEQHVSPGLYGAGYTDVHALLPAKEILAYISIVVAVAIIVFSNAVMRNLVWPGVSLALLAISAVAIGGIYPLAVQNFQVKPSLSDKERPYIERSISATRAAFGLTDTEVSEYKPTNTNPPADLPDDTSAQNVRLIDPQLVSQAFTQSQQSRGFYDFGEKLDVDRYTIDGKTQDYVVGAREINDEKLSAQQRNWLNRHTVYTHGYGLVAAPANKVCGGTGLPYFVSGFLGDSQTNTCSAPSDELEADQPRIYFGEQSTEYAIVGQADKSKNVEFDRPQEQNKDESVNYTYEGAGGVPIGSFFRRMVFAIKNTESNFLLSDAVNEKSRLMYIRTPRERVEKVAPFLTIDGDPYPAVIGGRITWILDGYTTAQTYPYAQKINLATETRDELTGTGSFALARDDVNYMRNSVKATVDAYDGTVKLYQFDDQDPVLKAWNQAFGGDLVIPKAQIPADLATHFRYPADMFKVQRNLLTKFHVTNPQTFFNGDDFWQVPNAPDQPQTGVKQPPFYLNVKLPEQDGTTFQLTSGVTPANRENMAALISASYDDGKPKIEVLELPDQSVSAGPIQVHRLMVNNANISQQLFGLNRNGQATVLYGNLISLPLKNDILYVEPVYVKSTQANAPPLLQKVLMSYGDGSDVVLENNLTDGLKALAALGKSGNNNSGTTTPPTTTQPNTPPGQLNPGLAAAAADVDKAIENLRTAQKAGDFAAQGQALKELDEAMTRFQQAQTAGAGPSAAPSGAPSAPPSTPPSAAPSATAGG
ncbi:uncharacterized membrane protein (UPF0182 family) [Actinoplanes octamycinicus]|uniref:UPF0182 protein BJY16_000777 n=1 Tax=Actinoplanes octamycinicus TaxID=135948 RepID=A0A7W7GS87_9ACTN|nr:UPF0182 family protein [Actinoplanes octamycinicus]MBB4737318.1 uncharacterized membrane protein (UPF0182 family) [Actinoplanes octamycinicus]GIE60401.1 UPF0182 protein [Actinoplanes octamycinicus]